jgi:hypothetical protein
MGKMMMMGDGRGGGQGAAAAAEQGKVGAGYIRETSSGYF